MKKFALPRVTLIVALVLTVIQAPLVFTLVSTPAAAQQPQRALPVVAIHVSELTQALRSLPATPPTPVGSGTTGTQWWTTAWPYFAMHRTLAESLRSDGTPTVVVTDADIAAGNLLLPGGGPRYPIVISLASEAIADEAIQPLRDYVSSGGFLFIGSSAFTRRPDGTSRGNFALAAELGLKMATSGLQNWGSMGRCRGPAPIAWSHICQTARSSGECR